MVRTQFGLLLALLDSQLITPTERRLTRIGGGGGNDVLIHTDNNNAYEDGSGQQKRIGAALLALMALHSGVYVCVISQLTYFGPGLAVHNRSLLCLGDIYPTFDVKNLCACVNAARGLRELVAS